MIASDPVFVIEVSIEVRAPAGIGFRWSVIVRRTPSRSAVADVANGPAGSARSARLGAGLDAPLPALDGAADDSVPTGNGASDSDGGTVGGPTGAEDEQATTARPTKAKQARRPATENRIFVVDTGDPPRGFAGQATPR
jgi:hypothetical protein